MGLWQRIWRRNFRIWIRRSQKGALKCGGVADEGIYHKPCQSLRSLSALRLSVFFWLKLNSFKEASKMAQHFMWQEPKLNLAHEGFIFSKWEDWIGLGKYLSVASLVTQLVKKLTCQFRRCKRCGSILGLGRSAGEGNGNPLWYSCLGNPVNRGA